jgi:hypothetical protein
MEPVELPRSPQRVVADHVHLTPLDRLDPVLLTRRVELDRPVHHPVIGEPQSGLIELGGAGGERVDLARSVEQRVLGVDVKMSASGGHRAAVSRLGAEPDGAAHRASRAARFTRSERV